MEALFHDLSLLANQILDDLDRVDASKVDDLMALFEQEAYGTFSAADSDRLKAMEDADASAGEVQAYIDALMDEAMDEYRRTCEEVERLCGQEMSAVTRAAEAAKKLGRIAMKKASASAAAASASSSKVNPC